MAIRMLWKFIVGRGKKVFRNYNVVERAENVLESNKRTPPRHPGTEAKFQVLIKDYKDLQEDLEKKPTDLLDRLKIVKVASESAEQVKKDARALPQNREAHGVPLFGFEEPKVIPEGRCTLRQALEFITNNQTDSTVHSVQSIARTYRMKESDVENIVKNFNVFRLYLNRDAKSKVVRKQLESLGVKDVVQPLYKSKFANESAIQSSLPDQKK